ncbi:hypothetical protein TWF481_007121 [Arthrobotrys musiformis]|uniref:Uncharacterized protein n=1 Tax=Arthrobotrys musiformis TaxID=47236 RepID=A0AAV9WC56_9PEZI
MSDNHKSTSVGGGLGVSRWAPQSSANAPTSSFTAPRTAAPLITNQQSPQPTSMCAHSNLSTPFSDFKFPSTSTTSYPEATHTMATFIANQQLLRLTSMWASQSNSSSPFLDFKFPSTNTTPRSGAPRIAAPHPAPSHTAAPCPAAPRTAAPVITSQQSSRLTSMWAPQPTSSTPFLDFKFPSTGTASRAGAPRLQFRVLPRPAVPQPVGPFIINEGPLKPNQKFPVCFIDFSGDESDDDSPPEIIPLSGSMWAPKAHSSTRSGAPRSNTRARWNTARRNTTWRKTTW